ncbi:hypothetical protein AURDEDRAFT_187380 [Auricularia subglabra TFB-10046 SS5]|nr:hypothetical protein AURDEDRAFT_187380 [Auricularia subglabra TFB-10046 SS5]
MPVIETPAKLQGPVTYGAFVVVVLDIESSIQGVSDERALEAARALPPVKCLAWIATIGNLEYSAAVGALRLSLVFQFVGHGLPDPPNSFAAVPIGPAPAHPETGRQPVEPNRPFPWPDCYIYTLRSFSATVSRIYHDEEPTAFLNSKEKDDVLIARYEDSRNVPAATSAAPGPPRQQPRIPSDLLVDEDDSDADGSGNYDDAYESSSDASSGRQSGSKKGVQAVNVGHDDRPLTQQDSSQAHDAASEPQAAPKTAPGMHLHVEIWGTIRPTDELSTADEFMLTVHRLFQIEKEWVDRTVTSILAEEVAPKATAWLQGISDADALGPPSEEDLKVPEPYEDDISPGDAVDDRMDKQLAETQPRGDSVCPRTSAHEVGLASPLDLQAGKTEGAILLAAESAPADAEHPAPPLEAANVGPRRTTQDERHIGSAATPLEAGFESAPRDESDDLEAGAPPKSGAESPAPARRASVISRLVAFVRSLVSRVRAFVSQRFT